MGGGYLRMPARGKTPRGWDYLVDSAEKIDEEENAMGKVAGKERQR